MTDKAFLRIVVSFIVLHLHHWETPIEMVCLYNSSNCSFSVLFRPLFSLEAAVSVFASTSSTSMSLNNFKNSPTNIKIWHFITKWLFGLHSCVIFNTFRIQSTHFMVTKTVNLRGISNYPRQNYLGAQLLHAGRKNCNFDQARVD